MNGVMTVYGIQEDIVSSSHDGVMTVYGMKGDIVSCSHDWGYDSVWSYGNVWYISWSKC